jgi:hypothetical protein
MIIKTKIYGCLEKSNYFLSYSTFLAPKVYGGIYDKTQELTKVKGFKDNVYYSDLKSLLIKDSSLSLKQEKWIKSISEGNISA